jgi:hypothetical protein
MSYDRPIEEDEDSGMPSSILFNNDMLRWSTQQERLPNVMDYHHPQQHHPTNSNQPNMDLDMAPLQAVVPSSTTNTSNMNNASTTATNSNTAAAISTSPTTATPLPAINTTNPALAAPPSILDPTKQYHPEWGVIKDSDFHPLTLKHQRDLENLYQTGSAIADFYFWQANLGGYCMADMVQGHYFVRVLKRFLCLTLKIRYCRIF